MKTTSKAFLVVAALTLAACPDDTTTYGAVCEPAPFTTADPTGAEAYCIDFYNAVCQRAFSDCGVELAVYAGIFTDYADCSASLTADCQADVYTNQGVNGGCANACIALIQSTACATFTGPEPTECAAATGTVASPPPACNATIGAGTISDVISSSDLLYSGATGSYSGYAKVYCISLTAGQTATFATSAPLSGTVIGDTYLHLLGPTGAQVAYNDDYSGLWSYISYPVPTSGTYRIIVRGYDQYEVGGYRLTVTIY